MAGTPGGTRVDWYTGYAFHFTSGGGMYAEPYSFWIDPAEVSPGTVSNCYIPNLGNISPGYSESAWILSQAVAGNANWVVTRAAVWEIMFNQYAPTSLSSGQLSDVSKLMTDAGNVDFTNFDFSGLYLALSPYDSPDRSFGVVSQDYLFHDPHAVPGPLRSGRLYPTQTNIPESIRTGFSSCCPALGR